MQSGAEIVVAHVIQQAVAPVFLLTGVGAILSVLTNRLSRIIDRFRTLDALGVAPRGPYTAGAAGAEDAEHHTIMQRRGEMKNLSRRRNWIHWAITSCTICALLICVVIATLFLASELGTDPSRLVGGDGTVRSTLGRPLARNGRFRPRGSVRSGLRPVAPPRWCWPTTWQSSWGPRPREPA
ncbi:conserved hypothetical protein [Burkholderiales bacterium]|nr:conserved hypothetical protein [Burkholderiales bacterium]